MEKRTSLSKKNTAYLIIVLFFLMKGIICGVFITPPYPLASSDDPGHISYVVYLAKEHSLPIMHQVGHDIVVINCGNDYVGNDFSTFNILKHNYDKSELGIYEADGGNWITQHPPLYYLFLLPFYMVGTVFTSSLPNLIIIMRMATLVFLGCGTLACLLKILDLLNIYGIARKCILAVFLFSAAIQYFLVMINNDAMVIFLTMLSLYLFIKYLKEGSLKVLYIFSFVCGCIVITKYTGALILPAYAVVYLYHSLFIKKLKIVEVFKQTFICLMLFAAVIAPILLRNYKLYRSLMPVFFEQIPAYNYSLYQFIAESGYLQEIYRHIIGLLGYGRMITVPMYMRYIWAGLLFFCFLTCIWNNKERNTYIQSCIIGLILCKVFLNISFYIGLAISAIVGIFIYKLFGKRKDSDFEIVLLSVLTICITVIMMFFNQYDIYLNRGHPGATHGRYYYTLFFPFFYLLFGDFEKIKMKHKRLILPVFLSVLMVMEVHMQYLCLKTW